MILMSYFSGTRRQRVFATGDTPAPPLLHGGFNFIFVVVAADILYRTVAAAGNRITLLVKLHPKVEAHAAQNVANLAQRLFAEVLGGQHFALRPLHQIANGLDARVLQAIIGADRKLQFVNRSIELIVAGERRPFGLLVAVILSVFLK